MLNINPTVICTILKMFSLSFSSQHQYDELPCQDLCIGLFIFIEVMNLLGSIRIVFQ